MSAAISAGTITVRPRLPEPSLSRWVAVGDPVRRSSRPTNACRISPLHTAGSGRRDVVVVVRPGTPRPSTGDDLAGTVSGSRSSSGTRRESRSTPAHPHSRHPEPVVRTAVG